MKVGLPETTIILSVAIIPVIAFITWLIMKRKNDKKGE